MPAAVLAAVVDFFFFWQKEGRRGEGEGLAFAAGGDFAGAARSESGAAAAFFLLRPNESTRDMRELLLPGVDGLLPGVDGRDESPVVAIRSMAAGLERLLLRRFGAAPMRCTADPGHATSPGFAAFARS